MKRNDGRVPAGTFAVERITSLEQNGPMISVFMSRTHCVHFVVKVHSNIFLIVYDVRLTEKKNENENRKYSQYGILRST